MITRTGESQGGHHRDLKRSESPIDDLVHAHATAKRRPPRGSAPARQLVPVICRARNVRRILDYGCGYGEDVALYRTQGYEAVGYDKYEHFPGATTAPTGRFDLVTLAYVLNVLRSRDDRLDALGEAAQFLTPSGVLLAVARSVTEVGRAARQGAWPAHADGYWSDCSKRTFQHGLDGPEICELGEKVGLGLDPLTAALPAIGGATRVLLGIARDRQG
jgi:SAM-dependent methyltransferase